VGWWVGVDNGGGGVSGVGGVKGVTKGFRGREKKRIGGGRGSADFSPGRTNFQGSLLRRSASRLETPSAKGALIIDRHFSVISDRLRFGCITFDHCEIAAKVASQKIIVIYWLLKVKSVTNNPCTTTPYGGVGMTRLPLHCAQIV